jgi:tetratricopeptide (TPR) repeat protein
VDVDGSDEAALTKIEQPGQMFANRQNLDATGEVAGPRDREYTRIHFESNLRGIAEAVKAAGGEVLFLTQTQNYADWPPGASLHRAGIPAAERAEFAALMDAARRPRKSCKRRLASLRAAQQIDNTYADLHFEVANCLREQGQYALARARYRLASNLDRTPVAAPSIYRDVIERVARESRSLYLDVEPTIDAEAARRSHGLVGYDFVIDAMHPTLRAHQLIALAIVERLRADDSPIASAAWQEEHTPFATPQQILEAHPSFTVKEHIVRGLSCLLVERNRCAKTEAIAALALEPADDAAKQLLALARLQATRASKEPPAESQ